MTPTPSPQIKVLVVDDHAVVREGICALLKLARDFLLVGEARNGREAVQMAHTHRPDVILMDLAMPVLNGVEATKQILATNPAARVLVLSAHSDEAYVERAITAGAAGFIEKQSVVDILTKGIREIARGRAYFSPMIGRRLQADRSKSCNREGWPRANPTQPTSRESEVLQLVAEGSANKQIAADLGISIKTVEKHRQRIMDKIHIHETAGLTRYAIDMGVVESGV